MTATILTSHVLPLQLEHRSLLIVSILDCAASSMLDTAKPSKLAGNMVSRDPHLESITAIAKILSGKNSALLANEKGGLQSS